MSQRDETRSAATGFDLFKPCPACGHDPRWIVLDPKLWAQIVMRATDDAGMRALLDQAVMGPMR